MEFYRMTGKILWVFLYQNKHPQRILWYLILTFDIGGSSKIGHRFTSHFFQKISSLVIKVACFIWYQKRKLVSRSLFWFYALKIYSEHWKWTFGYFLAPDQKVLTRYQKKLYGCSFGSQGRHSFLKLRGRRNNWGSGTLRMTWPFMFLG